MIGFLKEHQGFERRQFPVTSNWASKIGHACERHLYYMRTNWDKALLRDWKGISERGNQIADWWKRRMMGKGFSVIHDQVPLSKELRDKYQISGRIDGRVGWGEIKPVLYEFKTMIGHTYDKINSYLDIVNSNVPYIRMYSAQLQIYLYDNKESAGLFILCNPLTYEWKAIPVELNPAYCQWILERAERVNTAMNINLPPDRIPFHHNICGKCDYAHICLPGMVNTGTPLVNNDHLEQVLIEREALKEKFERYKELDEEAKTMAKPMGQDFVVNTSFKVEIKKMGKDAEKTRIQFIPL